ncbi:MAG: PilN domain-containing protein [Nitrospinae bacterium]|nr:PilN domain-containing protein [Nitrospinota bacterium]
MIKINLLADRQAKDRLVIQQQIIMALLAMAASVALCGFWWTVKASQISDTNGQITSAQEELERQKKIRAQVAVMQTRQDQVTAILAAIDKLTAVRRGPTMYLDTLNVLLPPEIWLTQLSDKNGVISLQGYAFSNNAVADLMRAMQQSDQFANIELGEIKKGSVGKGKEPINQFTLTGYTALGKKLADEKRKLEEKSGKDKKGKKGKK